MTKNDFDFDREFFFDLLERRHDATIIAKRSLWKLFDHWGEISENRLNGMVHISLGNIGERILGKVLEREFFIDVVARACVTCVMLEVILSVPALRDGVPVEIARFLVAPNNEILSSENETIFAEAPDTYLYLNDADLDESVRSYDVLIAVLRKVMEVHAIF
ncbi:hypothetical protein [Pseudomonas sp. PARCl1]|uniref:hypothetical protein n=1 Tax=Pseudomonas sp. PARCl1 TaxID=2853444 RepID=UPI00248E0E29|nr:hypothetical protein [Pseudomonas sp. PARCl1]